MDAMPPDLQRAWNSWFAVLEDLGHQRSVRKHLQPEQYRQLYHNLMATSGIYVDDPDSQLAEIAREMADFVDPWISLDILCGTDVSLVREIVREGDARFGHHWRMPVLHPAGIRKFMKVLVVTGILVSTILYWRQPELFSPAQSWIRGNWRTLLRFVDTNRQTFCGLVVLFAAAVAYYLHVARRY